MSRRTQTVFVDRGLHLLKYLSSAAGQPPHLLISNEIERPNGLQMIAAPGQEPNTLTVPGSAVVIVATEAVSITLEVVPAFEGGSLDAKVNLELVSPAGPRIAASTPLVDGILQPSNQGEAVLVRVVGHLARRGDVSVDQGAWLAGPQSPTQIEGLAFSLSSPYDLRINAQILVRGSDRRWSQWADQGQFVGTRGRALPLEGLRLRLVGRDADKFVLAAEAQFLGSALVRQSGTSLELVSAAGSDPLVGLKIGVVSARAEQVVVEKGSSRVRIFRASS